MKISVLGAGEIGSAIACDLVGRDAVTHVQVCDNRSGALRALAADVGSPKLRTVRVDLRDDRALASVLSGSACVIGSASGDLNPKLAAVAVEQGAHFCDLGGGDAAVAKQLALAPAAKRKSRWIVPNCGLAPGLVNMLVLRGVEQFTSVDTVTIRVGNIPIEAEPPFFHQFGYTAERLVEGYTAPVELVRDGAVVHVEPLSGLEEEVFAAPPFGILEAFHTAGKLSTLPHDLAGRIRTLDYKTLRHPGHARVMQAILALGFGADKSVDVRTHLSYRDLLVRSLRRTLKGEYQDAALVRVVLDGERDETPHRLTYEMIDRYDEASGFTAMQRSTSFPAASIAFLLASGAVSGGGAAPPENLIPKPPFFADLEAHGLDIAARWEALGEPVSA